MTDTVSSARRERNVTARMAFRNILWQEVVRIEKVSLGSPDVFPSMQRVNVEYERRALGNHKALLDLEIFHRLSEDDRSDRCNSKRLFNDSLHVLQLPKRLKSDFVIGRVHFIDFLDESILHVLMLRQKQKTMCCGRG